MKTKNVVVGLGEIGKPIQKLISKGELTIGFDINKNRISELNKGFDKTLEVNENEFDEAKNLTFTTDSDKIKKCNIELIKFLY